VLAATACATALALVAACVSTGVKGGGPIAGGAKTQAVDTCGGYSWCTAPAAAGGNGPAPQASSTDCGGYSWCTSAAAAVPGPAVDAQPPGRPPRVPGPDAPLPKGPGFCASTVDPPGTGLYIDPIDDEVIGTVLNSCLGGVQLAPKKFMLTLTLYWHPAGGTVWRPMVTPGQTVDFRIPYQYPAFTTTHVVAPCVTGASYFIKIQIPRGPNNLNYEGQPLDGIDKNGEQFDANGFCSHGHN